MENQDRGRGAASYRRLDRQLARGAPGRAGRAGAYARNERRPGPLAQGPRKDRCRGSRPACCWRCEHIDAIRTRRTLLDLAERLEPALTLGRAFAVAWDEAKQREGLIDFDDQIRRAAELLDNSDLSGWIRYKLDRRFDHILVDEAQDTNAAQWRIIDALTGDFFAGDGARGDILRTLFVVGDYKQAIFRFQGTNPENFRQARERVRARMHVAPSETIGSDPEFRGRAHLREYGLGESFRSAQDVLTFVDRALGHIGHAALGLDQAAEPHVGAERPGYVALWQPIGARADDEAEVEPDEGGGDGGGVDGGGEGWLSRPRPQDGRQHRPPGSPLAR